MGGSKIAAGRTQTLTKSRVMPPPEYAIRGMYATEIIPQHTNNKNFTRSKVRQSVQAAVSPMASRATAGGAATYQRSAGGSRHQGQSRTVTFTLRRLVRDEALMLHRFVRDTSVGCLVAAHRK